MAKTPDGFLEEIRSRMDRSGLDAESLARAAGVSDSNVRALLLGYWNFHIAKAVCLALGMPHPEENAGGFPVDA